MTGSQIQGGDKIIEAARVAHEKHWRSTSDESTGDKQAFRVTEAWQRAVTETSKDVETEVPVADDLRERIDVVDFSAAIAYEMKVSGKNPHHEFYKDIFKVIVYNNRHSEKKLEGLVFLTERFGVDKLNGGLGEAAQAVINSDVQYGFKVTVVSVRDW